MHGHIDARTHGYMDARLHGDMDARVHGAQLWIHGCIVFFVATFLRKRFDSFQFVASVMVNWANRVVPGRLAKSFAWTPSSKRGWGHFKLKRVSHRVTQISN